MPIPLWFVLELLDETSSIFHSYIIQSSSCNYTQAHTKKSFEAFFAIAMSTIKLSKYFLMKLYTESPEIRDQSRQMIYQILHCNRLFWILNWIGELFDWIILQFLEGKEELVSSIEWKQFRIHLLLCKGIDRDSSSFFLVGEEN